MICLDAQKAGFLNDQRPVVIVSLEIGRGYAGRDVGKLTFMIGLNLQQHRNEIVQIVIFIATGAVLIRIGIEELATEPVYSDFAHNEMCAALVPVQGWTNGEF